MNSDFSKSKTGDWAWTIKEGWCKITRTDAPSTFPLRIGSNDYGIDGTYLTTDKAPSAFLVPPAEFNAGSPPCEFKEDDRVIVGNNAGREEERAYFSHIEENEDRKYHCFYPGDKWASHGYTRGWRYCEKWEE
jgi:hypothetical protein